MANADSDDWNSDYSNYLISEKITDYDSQTLEELSVPILTKEEFEQKQIEKCRRQSVRKHESYGMMHWIILMVLCIRTSGNIWTI